MKTLSGFKAVKDLWRMLRYWRTVFFCRVFGKKTFGVTNEGQKRITYEWKQRHYTRWMKKGDEN